MAKQERVQPQTTERVEEPVEPIEPAPTEQAKDEKLKADLDAILDEIEEVLETNAVAMVRDFVQQGGE